MSRSCVLTHASGVSSHVCVDARVACLNTHAHLRAVFRVSAQKRVFLHSDLHYWCSVVPHAFFPFPHMCANTPLFVSTHRIHVPDVPGGGDLCRKSAASAWRSAAQVAPDGRQACPWRPLATLERRASPAAHQSRAARASGPKISSARK